MVRTAPVAVPYSPDVDAAPVIGVLGPIEVRTSSGSMALGSRQHVLLAVLAARAGSVVPADVLAEAIWGDDLPADPPAALHTLVSRLRARLPAGAIVTRAPGYLVPADPALVDLCRFEQLVDEAARLGPAEALARLDAAVALWRGPAFGSVADRVAVTPRAVELDELRVIVLERRADALVRLGRWSDAIASLDGLLAEQPLREHAVALIVEALARSSRQTDALRRVAGFRERLAEETGLEPGAELRRIEAAVLGGELDSGSPDAAGAPGPVLRLRVDTVERRPDERVAFATFGSGPPLLFLPGWLSCLDAFADGTDPRGALIARLAQDFTVTAFDRYGTGLSPSTDVDLSLEASVDEVHAVLDVLGDDVTVFASSCAGPSALIAAAERSTIGRLVLMCTFADGPGLFTNPVARSSLLDLVERSWGMGSRVIADLVVPGIDAVTRSDFARFQRRAASPTVAAGYLRQLYESDATSVLSRVRQRCLVLHYRDDPAIPFGGAHQLAFGLPDAELVALDGPYHTPPAGDLDRIAGAVVEFAMAESTD